MRIIITGATGMVGSEVIRQAIMDDEISEITAIVRRPLSINHPKLKTLLHKNFLDYSNLREVFKNNDACLWCLGISQNAVSKDEYIKITYDYAIAASTEMLAANPSIQFLFLSGEGAASDEKSRFLFGRIKGKTENALLKLPFKKLYIARPAGILPATKSNNYSFLLKLQYAMVRLMKTFFPSYVISADQLAKALLWIIKNGARHTILSYKELKSIAQKIEEQKTLR